MKQQPLLKLKVALTITGSRSIEDKQFVFNCLNDFLSTHELSPDQIILNSGRAIGVDTLAEEWAKQNDIPIDTFIPEWDRYGRSAGMVRNKEMVDKCEYVCAIWDGVSRGTKQCFEYATKKNKVVKIYEYNNCRWD